VGSAATPLKLEFGDIAAFPLTRKGGCKNPLQPGEIEAPRKARPGPVADSRLRVYRGAYPCAAGRTIEADHPPRLPRQLLVLGGGFLPNARQIDLPMGKAPSQP